MFRLETDGFLDEMPVEIMNPTGIAFSSAGEMFVTHRAEGRVCAIERGEEAVVYATGLGIATGIAFDRDGMMYVGDRSGTIYRIPEPASREVRDSRTFRCRYHMAFGPDGRLFVTAPGLASHDAVYAIDEKGEVESISADLAALKASLSIRRGISMPLHAIEESTGRPNL